MIFWRKFGLFSAVLTVVALSGFAYADTQMISGTFLDSRHINGASVSNQNTYFYGESSTNGTTAEKVVIIPSIDNTTEVGTGQVIVVKPTGTAPSGSYYALSLRLKNEASDTGSAAAIYYNGAAIDSLTNAQKVWNPGVPAIFVYDGSHWVFAGNGDSTDTTYTADGTTLQLNGTQFSAKTDAVANGAGTLTTGDQVYDFVAGFKVNDRPLTILSNHFYATSSTANGEASKIINEVGGRSDFAPSEGYIVVVQPSVTTIGNLSLRMGYSLLAVKPIY